MITKEMVENAIHCGHLQAIETHYDNKNNVQMVGYQIADVGIGIGVKPLWDEDDEAEDEFANEEYEEDGVPECISLWEMLVRQNDETVRILTETMNKIPVSGKVENYLKKSMCISAYVDAIKAEKGYSQMSEEEYDMCVRHEAGVERYALRLRLARCIDNYFYNLVNTMDSSSLTDELMRAALTWADNVFDMANGGGRTAFLLRADGSQILTKCSTEWYRDDFAKTVCRFLDRESERVKKLEGISEGAVKKIEKYIWYHMEAIFSM